MAEEIKEEVQKEEKKEEIKMDEKKVFGILSYLSILCLIPLFLKKDDEFVYFHAKQGLVLFIAEIAWYILNRFILAIFLSSIFTWGFFSIWGLINTLVNLGFLVLLILGIINVIQNKKKELPLIGKFAHNIKI